MPDPRREPAGAAPAPPGAPAPERRHGFVLYVAGTAPRSLRAIANTRRFCEQFLTGCFTLEVVDIYQEPTLAEAAGVLAVPVLVKTEPLPEQRFIGDMSDTQQIAASLGFGRSEGERQSNDGADSARA